MWRSAYKSFILALEPNPQKTSRKTKEDTIKTLQLLLSLSFFSAAVSASCLDAVKKASRTPEAKGFHSLGAPQLLSDPHGFLKLSDLKATQDHTITLIRKHPYWSAKGGAQGEPYVLYRELSLRSDHRGRLNISQGAFREVLGRDARAGEHDFADFIALKQMSDRRHKDLPQEMKEVLELIENFPDHLFIYVQEQATGPKPTAHTDRPAVIKRYQKLIAHPKEVRVIDLDPDQVGFVGQLMLPAHFKASRPSDYQAAVLWGGSSSRPPLPEAYDLVARGHVVIALQYFTFNGKDPNVQKGHLSHFLDGVPLERLAQPVRYLIDEMGLPAQNITVAGYSRGGEAALLFAEYLANDLGIQRVLPIAAIDNSMGNKIGPDRGIQEEGPAWTLRGQPAPANFVKLPPDKQLDPYTLEIAQRKGTVSYVVLNGQRLPKMPLIDGWRAILPPGQGNIHVGNYRGRLVMISGSEDGFWPALPAMQRLRQQRQDRTGDGFLLVAGAGHVRSASNPSTFAWARQNIKIGNYIYPSGGTPKANILYDLLSTEVLRRLVEGRSLHDLPFAEHLRR